MEDSKTLVSLQNIALHYENKAVLYDINLEIMPHDFLTLIGPNGAGKTSLLKLIVGLEKPSSGKIIRRQKLKISYMPQRFRCDTTLPLTVEEFIRLAVRKKKAEIRAALEKTGAEQLEQRFLHQLSGGETQRVMMSKAILTQPDLIILDEPGQNMDLNGQLQLYRLIEEIFKSQNCSLVMVSHDIHFVMSLSNTVICMYKHICCQGKPESVSAHESFIRHFGRPDIHPLTFYPHHHGHNHTHKDTAV